MGSVGVKAMEAGWVTTTSQSGTNGSEDLKAGVSRGGSGQHRLPRLVMIIHHLGGHPGTYCPLFLRLMLEQALIYLALDRGYAHTWNSCRTVQTA